jgi:hypothetical protein
MARCQITSEKSSKNHISLFDGKPARGLPTPPPPPPLRKPLPHIFHVLEGKCEPQVRDLLARIPRGRGGGRAGWFAKTVPFDNGSSDQLQTQNQDSQYHSAPLSNSYWWFMASFSEFILWREAIKGRRSQWPALSRLHCILQATPLWRRKSATATQVEQ